MRPSWDEYFLNITLEVAKRSTCLRAQVGAIIVKDKRILTTGYNGAPKGLPHCLEEGCEIVNGHCVRTLHAEQNAILQAALYGVSLEGGAIYTTHQPCHGCAKMIINAGLVRVVYAGNYPDELAMKYLRLAGVQIDHLDLGDRTPAPPPEHPRRQALLIFLKLGGSAITDKTRETTPRIEVIRDAARAIRSVREKKPDLRLLLGHGSGSFGHYTAQKWGFGQKDNWRAFAETGASAQRLNRLVTDILLDEGVPVLSIQPSSSVNTRDGKIYALDYTNIATALDHNLIPLIHGDVAFDDTRGMAIASTDALFAYLAPILNPTRIIYATAVNGIYTADPITNPGAQLIPEITPKSFQTIRENVGAAHGIDVTGGMIDKLQRAVTLVEKMPDLEILIVSCETTSLLSALSIISIANGTRIHN